MFKNFKSYCHSFCHEEEGGELVEYAIVIAIVALLAAAVLGIVSVVKGKVEDAGKEIGAIDPGGATPGGSPSPTTGVGGLGG